MGSYGVIYIQGPNDSESGYVCGCSEATVRVYVGSCTSARGTKRVNYDKNAKDVYGHSGPGIAGIAYCPEANYDSAGNPTKWPGTMPSQGIILGCFHAGHPHLEWSKTCQY